eukprot:768602-Hanusia_phi.AAC.15
MVKFTESSSIIRTRKPRKSDQWPPPARGAASEATTTARLFSSRSAMWILIDGTDHTTAAVGFSLQEAPGVRRRVKFLENHPV